MKTNHILAGALCAVSVFALAASAYGIRTRNVAIDGWQAWAAADAERQRLVVEKDASFAREIAEAEAAVNATASAKYRALWTTVLGKIPEDDFAFALALNEYIHRNVKMGLSDTKGDVASRLATAVLSGDETALCGDYSLFLQMALQASGIPSRTVQLAASDYVDGKMLGATHVTVEVLRDSRWVIVDPTFNATFSCGTSSDPIGVEDARRCSNLVAHQLAGTLPGRSVAEHNVPYSDLLAYWAANSTRVGDKFINWQSYPNDDWLREANQRQQRRNHPEFPRAANSQAD